MFSWHFYPLLCHKTTIILLQLSISSKNASKIRRRETFKFFWLKALAKKIKSTENLRVLDDVRLSVANVSWLIIPYQTLLRKLSKIPSVRRREKNTTIFPCNGRFSHKNSIRAASKVPADRVILYTGRLGAEHLQLLVKSLVNSCNFAIFLTW